MSEPNSIYTFNNNDYKFIVRLFNSVNDIYLTPESWDDLIIEEDIFNWQISGSITIRTPMDSLERDSDDALKFGSSNNMVYKFRNDGRDTIYLYILPQNSTNLPVFGSKQFDHNIWGIELECVIYDCTEDSTNDSTINKHKKLFFIEKSYQLMTEKNIEFTTATVGSNANNPVKAYKRNDEDRSLKTGEALGELIYNDTDFTKYSDLYKKDQENSWNMGDDKNKILYSSPTNNKFIDDISYIVDRHTATESEQYQPCILKMEKSKSKGQPKQFSFKSIQQYFKNAGTSSPGDYLIEHFILEEYNVSPATNVVIAKVPQENQVSTNVNKNITAEDYSIVKNYKLIDLSGIDNAQHLNNRCVISRNMKTGQFNIESNNHKAEKYKDFYKDTISPNIVTTNKTDRLTVTPFITNGYNIDYIYSTLQSEQGRYVDGRNKLLKYYLFSNLGISFTTRGLTIRQPGRFFSLTRNTKNDREYDHKIEGQYFITNVIHHFSNIGRNYSTQIIGIKTHTYKETTQFQSDDVLIIK